MNTSSRVPGITRNSGWLAVDAEIAARRVLEVGHGAGDQGRSSNMGARLWQPEPLWRSEVRSVGHHT